jgi:hypothetical protein
MIFAKQGKIAMVLAKHHQFWQNEQQISNS